MTNNNKEHSATHLLVRRAYGKVAETGCSGSSCCGEVASKLSLGDLGLSGGGPVAFSKIKKGMTVLDLGSGAGKELFIAAPLAGTKGKVIAVDMTPQLPCRHGSAAVP